MTKTTSQVAQQAIAIVQALGKGREQELGIDENNNPHWHVFCPAHNDVNTPSLHVSFHDKILLHCRAGCKNDEIIVKLKSMGLWSQSLIEPFEFNLNKKNKPLHLCMRNPVFKSFSRRSLHLFIKMI